MQTKARWLLAAIARHTQGLRRARGVWLICYSCRDRFCRLCENASCATTAVGSCFARGLPCIKARQAGTLWEGLGLHSALDDCDGPTGVCTRVQRWTAPPGMASTGGWGCLGVTANIEGISIDWPAARRGLPSRRLPCLCDQRLCRQIPLHASPSSWYMKFAVL